MNKINRTTKQDKDQQSKKISNCSSSLWGTKVLFNTSSNSLWPSLSKRDEQQRLKYHRLPFLLSSCAEHRRVKIVVFSK